MKDEEKTKEELIHELNQLKRTMDDFKDNNRQTINDERYNLLLENISDVIYRVDSNFTLIDVSPSVERLSGYTSDELIGKPFNELKFLSPESLENTYSNLKKIMKEGQLPVPTEYEFLTKDGKKKYMEVKSTPIFENDKFIELIAIARDITDRKIAEKALKESEEELSSIFNGVLDGLAVVDMNGNVVKINKRLLEVGGYSKEEINGKKIDLLEMFPPDSIEKLLTGFETVISTGSAGPIEVEVFLKNGDKKKLEVVGSPIKRNNEVIGIVASIRDITKRKESESALRESEERYRGVINLSPDGIVLHNMDRKIIMVNNRILEMYGTDSKESVIGCDSFDFVDPAHRDRALKSMTELLNTGYVRNLEYNVLRKDGTIYPAEINAALIRDDSGDPIHILSILRDVTDHKKAEQKIITERKRAEFYLDLLGHDINNFNQAIVSYNEMLSSKTDMPEDYRKYSKNSLQQALEISELISKVEKLSQLQKGEYEAKKMDIIPILNHSTEILTKTFPDKVIEINSNLPNNEMMIKGNELLLDVFTNLLTNAVKYNNNHKILLDISNNISDDEKYWKFEFKDNGPGIPDEMKEIIFKRFERGENNVQGRGLGLTIAREVINQIGGEIWVEDRVKGNSSRGSNFVVLLPRED